MTRKMMLPALIISLVVFTGSQAFAAGGLFDFLFSGRAVHSCNACDPANPCVKAVKACEAVKPAACEKVAPAACVKIV